MFHTIKYSELTNHYPLMKLMINCKVETIHSFNQKKYNTA